MRGQHPYKNMPGDDRYLVVSKDELEAILATLGNATSGVYTPQFSGLLNVSAVVASVDLNYSRNGDMVIVSGLLEPDAVLATGCFFQMSLPVASDLASANQLAGSGVVEEAVPVPVVIYGNSTNNTAVFHWVAGETISAPLPFIFMYRVV